MNSPTISLRARLAGIACTVPVVAAVDTLMVRAELVHRPLDPQLYLQSLALWSGFALLALVPALLTDAVLRERGWIDGSVVRAALRHGAWTALPVVVHACIDQYTEMGGSVSQLGRPEPWLRAALAVAVLVATVWVLGRALARVRPAVVGLASIALASGAGLCVSFHEGESIPDAPPRSGAHPNVLLLVWDTTRAANLDLYGYDRSTTPNLAKLAEQGLVFTHSRAVANYTLTSHVSLLTGVYPSHHGAKMTRQHFDARATPSVTTAFKAAGYRTGAFVGTDVLHANTGVSVDFDRFDDEVDPPVCYTHAWALVHDAQSVLSWKLGIGNNNGLPHWFQDFQRPAETVLARARAWIGNGDPRPWFCLVNLYDVHWPYLPEPSARERMVQPYDGIVDGYSRRSDRVPDEYELSDADKRHLVELYDAELWQLDHAVDLFLRDIDLARTAVVMTSDHGEAFGEGGIYEHHDIIESQLRVPLVVRPAGGAERRVIDTPTSGVDIAPTLLALANVPAEPTHTGLNLLGELPRERQMIVEDRDHGDRTDIRIALYSADWKLVRLGLGEKQRWELFDLAADPHGLRDVAGEHPDVLARLKPELERFRGRWSVDDARDTSGGMADHNRALRALGYAGDAGTTDPPH